MQVLIIREKLAELYESEQQWSKAAQMLSGIDLDSGMRSASRTVTAFFINANNFFHSLICASFPYFCRAIDDTFRLSKCVQIARLYLEVGLKFLFVYSLLTRC